MIDFLLGVPGKLKTISDYLTTYWTAARAAKLDNLDAAISTTAPASTAVVRTTYTADISALNTAIGTRMAGIKAIYRGYVEIPVGLAGAEATITAVNMSKSICLFNGFTTAQAYLIGHPTVQLSSTTTVTADVGSAVTGSSTVVRFTVIEFL